MPQSVHPLIEARRDQMFPVLASDEIDRLWRFGEFKSYPAGERMIATGEIAPGAFVILAGRVDVTQRGRQGQRELIVTHCPGSFMGELAQLSDRPSLVDAFATEAVDAFVIPPQRLRDLMVEEAELGERIMRALILRRVGLLDMGAGGPVSIHERPSPDHSRSAVTGHASYSSRASGTITFSDSCRCIASHFAFAYRVAYPVLNQDTDRSPGVTHESSVSCRQQTPWCDG